MSSTFDSIVQSGVVLVIQTSTGCTSIKVVLLGLLQIATLTPQEGRETISSHESKECCTNHHEANE